MKLKERFAEKFFSENFDFLAVNFGDDKHTALATGKAFVAGFDKAKALYCDYATRFLTEKDLKLFQQVGEQEYPHKTDADDQC